MHAFGAFVEVKMTVVTLVYFFPSEVIIPV